MADTSGIDEAFELLLQEIEAVSHTLREEGAEALRAGRLDEARRIVERVRQVHTFREQIRALRSEWNKWNKKLGVLPVVPGPGGSRPRKGLGTPRRVYRIAILESLIELGGSGKVREVLERVEAKIGHRLNDHDRKPLKSGQIRWRNTAMWCRKDLVEEGLLARDSDRGTWEITEQGRRWLEELRGETEAADPDG